MTSLFAIQDKASTSIYDPLGQAQSGKAATASEANPDRGAAKAFTGIATSDADKTQAASFVSGSPSLQTSSLVLLQGNLSTSVNAQTSTSASASSSPFASWFTSADTDGDGSLSEDDFVAARPDGSTKSQAAALFAAIDTEGTGSITLDQIKQAFADAA